MKKYLASVLLVLSLAARAAQTPSQILAQGAAFQALSDNQLSIAKVVLLSLLANGIVLSPSTIMAQGAAFQALSDRDLQICMVSLLNNGAVVSGGGTGVPTNVFITVSSRGITNGLSSVANDGNDFGPDTPGTTTSGLQEALNAPNKGVNYGPGAAGFGLRLTSGGYFYYTNALYYSNTFTTGIKIEGNTLLDTKLVYAGAATGTNCITFCGGGNVNAGTLNLPLHVVIRDVGFSAIVNTTNVLLYVTNYSHAEIANCNFTGWQIMTNQAFGSAVSINNLNNITTPGLVGLCVGANGEHGTFLNDNYFANLAVGLEAHCDHLYVRGIKFAGIGQDKNLTDATLWPNTSPRSLGHAILRYPGLDSHYLFAHFYSCAAGIGMINPGGLGDVQQLFHPLYEGCDTPFSAVNTNTVSFFTDGGDFDESTQPSIINTSPYSFTGNAHIKQTIAVARQWVGNSFYYLVTPRLYVSGAFYGNGAGLTNVHTDTLTATNQITGTGTSNYLSGDLGIAGNLYVGGAGATSTNFTLQGNMTAYSVTATNNLISLGSNVFGSISYSTNQNQIVPDFTPGKGFQLMTTNAAFTFLAPIGIDTTKTTVQTTAIYVTNTTAAVVIVTPPANCHAVGTMNVTNLTRFTFECYAQKFTNVFGVPIF
jgi:hypothetical protein